MVNRSFEVLIRDGGIKWSARGEASDYEDAPQGDVKGAWDASVGWIRTGQPKVRILLIYPHISVTHTQSPTG